MGNDKWLDYLSKFKFGLPTRFGMGNETYGSLPGDNYVTIAMSSFGQGIGVTQVQMLRAFSSVANDGVMVEPKFINAIHDPKTIQLVRLRRKLSEILSQKKQLNHSGLYGSGRNRPLQRNPECRWRTRHSSGRSECRCQVRDAQIASENGYLEGENDYIYSVVAMTPAEILNLSCM